MELERAQDQVEDELHGVDLKNDGLVPVLRLLSRLRA